MPRFYVVERYVVEDYAIVEADSKEAAEEWFNEWGRDLPRRTDKVAGTDLHVEDVPEKDKDEPDYVVTRVLECDQTCVPNVNHARVLAEEWTAATPDRYWRWKLVDGGRPHWGRGWFYVDEEGVLREYAVNWDSSG